MTREEIQLLLKDLCSRLPYGVMCHANEINLDGDLLFINKVYNIVALYNDNAVGKFNTCPIADVKPYLRPMSSMTEEEEVYYSTVYTTLKFYEKEDWLNAHHFDYRIVPSTGKSMIESGLALEAKEDMYKTNN